MILNGHDKVFHIGTRIQLLQFFSRNRSLFAPIDSLATACRSLLCIWCYNLRFLFRRGFFILRHFHHASNILQDPFSPRHGRSPFILSRWDAISTRCFALTSIDFNPNYTTVLAWSNSISPIWFVLWVKSQKTYCHLFKCLLIIDNQFFQRNPCHVLWGSAKIILMSLFKFFQISIEWSSVLAHTFKYDFLLLTLW